MTNLPYERIATLQNNLYTLLNSPTVKTYLQAISLVEEYEQAFVSLNTTLTADEIKLFRDLVITPALNEINDTYKPNISLKHDICSMYPKHSILKRKDVK